MKAFLSNSPRTRVGLTVAVALVVGVSSSLASAAGARPGVSDTHEVIISAAGFPSTLNPLGVSAPVIQDQLGLTQPMGNLFTTAPNGAVAYPEMVAPPTVSSDGLTINFSLKSGMEWSDGTSITNDDYVFAYNVLLNAGFCQDTCDSVQSVSEPDGAGGLEIELTMKHAYGPALPNALVGILPHTWSALGSPSDLSACLAASSACGPVVSSFESNNYEGTCPGSQCPVTAGPYQVSVFSSGSEIDYIKNPSFQDTMGLASPATVANEPQDVKFTSYPDFGLVSAADSQATDVTSGYRLDEVSGLQADANFTTSVGLGGGAENLIFNALKAHPIEGSSPANSIVAGGPGSKGEKVRQALFLAINFPAFIASSFKQTTAAATTETTYCTPIFCAAGDKAPFNDGGHEPGVWDSLTSTYEKPGTSTARTHARKLFTNNCGCSAAKPANLYITAFSQGGARLAEEKALQSVWQKVFRDSSNHLLLKVHLTVGNGGPSGNFEAELVGYAEVQPDPDHWKPFFLPSACPQINSAPQNQAYACYQSSAIDTALNAAAATSDQSVRLTDYHTFQRLVNKGAFWHVMAPIPAVWTTDGKPTAGLEMNPWDIVPTWNAQDWQQ